jgi:hypothetical protein
VNHPAKLAVAFVCDILFRFESTGAEGKQVAATPLEFCGIPTCISVEWL